MIVFLPRSLDDAGRCCGRKPIFYKTRRGMGGPKDPHHFCATCDAEFGVDGQQRPNWAWAKSQSGFVRTGTTGLNPRSEDWAAFFAVEPSARRRWLEQHRREIAGRSR